MKISELRTGDVVTLRGKDLDMYVVYKPLGLLVDTTNALSMPSLHLARYEDESMQHKQDRDFDIMKVQKTCLKYSSDGNGCIIDPVCEDAVWERTVTFDLKTAMSHINSGEKVYLDKSKDPQYVYRDSESCTYKHVKVEPETLRKLQIFNWKITPEDIQRTTYSLKKD